MKNVILLFVLICVSFGLIGCSSNQYVFKTHPAVFAVPMDSLSLLGLPADEREFLNSTVSDILYDTDMLRLGQTKGEFFLYVQTRTKEVLLNWQNNNAASHIPKGLAIKLLRKWPKLEGIWYEKMILRGLQLQRMPTYQ